VDEEVRTGVDGAIDTAIARTIRDGRMTEEGAYLRAAPLD
jgi:hypothetical protein